MGKLLFFHFRVTISKLENRKFQSELLTQKNENHKTRFPIIVTRKLFIRMKFHRNIKQLRMDWKKYSYFEF